MLKEYNVDLHIHTCLSPCADLTMLPTAIIKQARIQNLDMIGITDHNSAENVYAVKKAGEKEKVEVLGGIEITSQEEIHILAFFDSFNNLKKMQEIIYKNLPAENDEKAFGEQIIVDENDNIIGKNNLLLIGATNLGINEIVVLIHQLDGIAVASHVDRDSFSITRQLGFIPEDLELDAIELSCNYKNNKNFKFKNYNFPLLTSSDAHFLSDIGKTRTTFYVEDLSFSELKKAFQSSENRKVLI